MAKPIRTALSSKPLEPGYFQQTARVLENSVAAPDMPLPGRKTGRVAQSVHPGPTLSGEAGFVAPNRPKREAAWEDTLRRHDLLPSHPSQVGSNTTFDRQQGQLFDPQVIQPRDTTPDVTRARAAGAMTGDIYVEGKTNPKTGKKSPDQTIGLAGAPGFLPTLKTTKDKVQALKNTQQARLDAGTDRGTGGTTSEMMADRKVAHDAASAAPWYMGVNERGEHDRTIQGEAARVVHEAAARNRVTDPQMARQVAIHSPQQEWQSEGGPRSQTQAGGYPNLESAEHSMRGVDFHLSFEPDAASETIREVGRQNAKFSLGEMSAKAAEVHAENRRNPDAPVGPLHVKDVKSQKAPNFDASLNLSHIDPAVQRIAAQSWTADRHDSTAVGVDADKGLAHKRGVYEVVAMTGRRSALLNRQLNPNEQARQWVGERHRKQSDRGNEMFTGPNETPRTALVQQEGARTFRRRGSGPESPAEKYGLEF